jgi:hypothetical protein
LAAVAPLLFFGIDGTVQLYQDWREQVNLISAPDSYLKNPSAPLVSLRKAAATLTGHAPDAWSTNFLLTSFWIAWTLALAWYFHRALRTGTNGPPSRAGLADWTVLLLAPLPFSPWLEPYHAVPLLPGAILCATVSLDRLAWRKDRVIGLGALGLLVLIRMLINLCPWPLRGIAMLVTFLALVTGLGMLRPRLGSSQEPVTPAN